MVSESQRELITDISRELVMIMAPEELPLFRSHSETYFNAPEKLFSAKTNKDEMLGFGAEAAVVFLTPLVLKVTDEIIKFLTDEVKKSIKDETGVLISKVVKKVFKKLPKNAYLDNNTEQDKEYALTLTPVKIDQLRDIVLNRARQLKISESKADILANTIIGSLL